jgi:hypothetical protein
VDANPDSLAFVTAIAELATRLATDQFVLYGMRYSTDLFGGWECEWGRRRRRVKVTWEGKDQHLVVATAELASGSKERRWQIVEDHDFRGRQTTIANLMRTAHAAVAAHAGPRAGLGAA